ncbi:DUF5335 domain-containing protein [Noviherbaspirillum sedimenti]|uniref:DUF5335 domain-containing protein n=1 Tax=Noviherbaspirillum sedimenti TaxID=2320865 RepID=UPI001F38FAAC|nr:DUF5335 domain-containing protein [Noviherbaspirillum sedimenti]
MSIAKLQKEAWRPYFDAMSKELAGKTAEIAVDSLKLGHQIEAEWLPLYGLVYDPKSDIFEVVMEGLDHMIAHPQEVYVDVDASGLNSVEVIDEDDVRQIISLRSPLLLPQSLH